MHVKKILFFISHLPRLLSFDLQDKEIEPTDHSTTKEVPGGDEKVVGLAIHDRPLVASSNASVEPATIEEEPVACGSYGGKIYFCQREDCEECLTLKRITQSLCR